MGGERGREWGFLFFKLNIVAMEKKKRKKPARHTDTAENQKNQIPHFKICSYRS